MKWYAIFVFTGEEQKVFKQINYLVINKNFSFHCQLLIPTRTIYEYKRGVMVCQRKALFPGYILIKTNNIEEFLMILRTCSFYGRVLKQEDLFVDIPVEEIMQITCLMDESGNIGISKIILDDKQISKVNGPLSQYRGKIHKINRRKRRVKISLFFNSIEYKIDLSANIFMKEDESNQI